MSVEGAEVKKSGALLLARGPLLFPPPQEAGLGVAREHRGRTAPQELIPTF